MIYVVHILDQKFVKVGFTSDEDVSVRIAQLQTGCPFEIKELFTVEGTLRQEKAIHTSLGVAFGRIRIPVPPNEWYPGRNAFFQSFMENMRYGAEFGLSFSEKYNPSVKQPSTKRQTDTSTNYKWPTKD